MTGKLVCPIGPDTKLEAHPTGQEVEVWGVCIAYLEPDFRLSKLEVCSFTFCHEVRCSNAQVSILMLPDFSICDLASCFTSLHHTTYQELSGAQREALILLAILIQA